MRILIKISAIVGFLLIMNVVSADDSYYSQPGQIKIVEINPGESWVKLYNTGSTNVDLAGWVLYDENDGHELFVTKPDIVSDNADKGLMLSPRSEIIITGKNDTDFMLYNEGGEVRLYSGPVEIDGILQDKITYPAIEKGSIYVALSPYGDKIVNLNNNSNLDSQSAGQNFQYEIPENGIRQKNSQLDKNNDNGRTNRDDKNQEAKRNKNKNSGLVSYNEINGITNVNQNINSQNNSEGPKEDTPTFTASSAKEKTPYGLLYRLWGSWFLWRTILPLIGLWMLLYGVTLFIRKKYFS